MNTKHFNFLSNGIRYEYSEEQVRPFAEGWTARRKGFPRNCTIEQAWIITVENGIRKIVRKNLKAYCQAQR